MVVISEILPLQLEVMAELLVHLAIERIAPKQGAQSMAEGVEE
ncbi:MAG TPA: hypothetical protein VGM77_07445 [Gemmatimonadales bacterium]